MAFADVYRRQTALLVRLMPAIAPEACFALKGGTAINLFVRDLPRLSVDIDLAYLPVEDRATSLAAIEAALTRIAGRVERGVRDARVRPMRSKEGTTVKLLVRAGEVDVKVEVTPVLRGTVFAPEWRRVSPATEDQFGFAEAQVVSPADLYAGKLVAALDRQHPRDLFDMRGLLAAEGVDAALRRAFLVYLVSHGRPVHELLDARRHDLAAAFERSFDGMTREPVALDDLLATREAMIAQLVDAMPDHHRAFLLAFERGQPDWSAIGLDDAAGLPAVRWRQQNLDRLDPDRRSALVARLEAVLALPAPQPPRPAPRPSGSSFSP